MPKEIVKKGTPIVIPGAEFMSPEELKKAKQREKSRRFMARRNGGEVYQKYTKQELRKIKDEEMVSLSKDTRNLVLQVLNDKLLTMSEDAEEMKKINLATLATTFGILYDKVQLMNGQATQNIAIHSKIDVTMKSDKALEELNRMREAYTDQKE